MERFKRCSINNGIRSVQKKAFRFWLLFFVIYRTPQYFFRVRIGAFAYAP